MNTWGNETNQARNVTDMDQVNKQAPTEVVKNRVYFYSPVNKENALSLNSKLRATANILLMEQKALGLESPIPIYLHISSYGGVIFDGLSAMDEVKNSPVPVYTVIDGCCASAATFMSVAGKKRFINRHSFILIHQIISAFWGTNQEFEDHVKNMRKFMKIMKGVYREHTKISMKKLDEILKHDLWFDANEALKLGLVDEII